MSMSTNTCSLLTALYSAFFFVFFRIFMPIIILVGSHALITINSAMQLTANPTIHEHALV